MRISGRTYWPASFVVAVCTTPVSAFFAVTLAFAITAPDGSVTVPNIVASCPNASTEPKNNKAKLRANPRRHVAFIYILQAENLDFRRIELFRWEKTALQLVALWFIANCKVLSSKIVRLKRF